MYRRGRTPTMRVTHVGDGARRSIFNEVVQFIAARLSADNIFVITLSVITLRGQKHEIAKGKHFNTVLLVSFMSIRAFDFTFTRSESHC